MKRGRLWFPLDVHFWDDPDVVAMGESAAILFQKLIAYAKVHATDGVVPMATVRALGGRRWSAKMAAIVGQGVVAVTDIRTPSEHHFVASVADIEGSVWCRIVSFLAWNDSSDEIMERRVKSTEKKRKQRDHVANVPRGQHGGVPRESGTQEKEKRKEEIDTEERATLSLERARDSRSMLVIAFKSRWESARSAMWPGPNGDPDWDRAGRWVDETARIRGMTPEAVIARVLDNWFADPYVVKNNHPTRHFAKNFANFVDPPEPAKQRGQAKATSHEEFARLAAAAEKGDPCVGI